MKFLVISGSPKEDGLCCSVGQQVLQGARDGGAETKLLRMEGMIRCQVCKDGWGICRSEHKCAFEEDGFDKAQAAVKEADGICLLTPVYWGEQAEGLKCFLDRLRRCEFGQNGAMSGKPVLMIACPGGSGNGMLSCLEEMDRLCRHLGAVLFDYIGVNRWNQDYKKQAAYTAAKVMAEGRKAGESI